MSRKIIKIFLGLLFCFFAFSNVYASQNSQITIRNDSIHITQDKSIIESSMIKKFDTNNNVLCEGKFGTFIKQIFQLIKFAVPVLIVTLAIIDFIKAMTFQKQEEIKNAADKLLKRILIGAVIFVLPTIIDVLLNISGITSSTCNW